MVGHTAASRQLTSKPGLPLLTLKLSELEPVAQRCVAALEASFSWLLSV